VPRKKPTTTKNPPQEGPASSSRRSARIAVPAITKEQEIGRDKIVPTTDTVVGEAQAMESGHGDDEEEEDETKFAAKRIVKTKDVPQYVKEGGVRVMKVCVLRDEGLYANGRTWTT
jgi:hypothetical protein